jgi:hypothetical protein
MLCGHNEDLQRSPISFVMTLGSYPSGAAFLAGPAVADFSASKYRPGNLGGIYLLIRTRDSRHLSPVNPPDKSVHCFPMQFV